MKQQSVLVLLYNGKYIKLGVTWVFFTFKCYVFRNEALTAKVPPGFDNFNLSCTQKSHHILVPRLVSVPHKPPKTIGYCRSK